MSTAGRSAEFTDVVTAAYQQAGHVAITSGENQISVDFDEIHVETRYFQTPKHPPVPQLRNAAQATASRAGGAKPILVISSDVDDHLVSDIKQSYGVDLVGRQKLRDMVAGNIDLKERFDQVLRG